MSSQRSRTPATIHHPERVSEMDERELAYVNGYESGMRDAMEVVARHQLPEWQATVYRLRHRLRSVRRTNKWPTAQEPL